MKDFNYMHTFKFLKQMFETDDLDFFDEFLQDKPEEEIKRFWEDNSDFLRGYPISKEHVDLLKDSAYLGILHNIKNHQETNRTIFKNS